jgi:hypothetical protein
MPKDYIQPMKLKKLLSHSFIIEFEGLLKTDFERELFLCSLRNYCSHGNPLRFHNFAFSMRELVLQIIDRRAPDKEVEKACWYEKESERFSTTRRQKLKFCAQGFLSDAYLEEDTIEDLNQSIKDYLKEFNFFNKYTHITPKHLKACPQKFYADMKFIIQRSQEVIEELDSLESMVTQSLEIGIQDEVFEAVINSCPDELSILASSVIVEQVSPEKMEVEYLEENGITIGVEGTIYITLEYGKGDDCFEISNDFPFYVSVEACITNPGNISVNTNELEVDTRSWYE